MRTQVEENFSAFYERWLSQLEAYRVELLKVSKERQNDHACQAAVSKLTSHFKEYYTTKWEMAKDDILAFYASTWLTPLEKTHLWVTGWKPSMLFRVLDRLSSRNSTLALLAEEQIKKLEGLKVKIRVEEDRVEREMERQQVAMADRQMVELARTAIRARNSNQAAAAMGNVDGLVEVAIKSLLASLERLMKAADCVRLKTLKWLLEVLSPKQCVDFLAAEADGHIQLRQWGMKKQSEAAASASAVGHPRTENSRITVL